jgi:copper chaperone CopZ
MEEKEITIAGISCMSCVSKIEKALYSNAAIQKVSIDKETGKALLSGASLPHQDIITSLVESAGDYKIDATYVAAKKSKTSMQSYKPLLIIVLYLLGTTLLIE